MPRKMPPPEFVTETVEGFLIQARSGAILALGALPPALESLPRLAEGLLYLRYAIPYNSPGLAPLIPGLFVSERGVALTGREAWDFMQEHFQLYPRADLIGITANGQQEQAFLRALDFGAPVVVYAFSAPDGPALAQVKGRFTGANAVVPPLLAQYVAEAPPDALGG